MFAHYYSLRMRATRDGRHLSGAERIVPADKVAEVSAQLIARAMQYGDLPDDLHCHVEQVELDEITFLSLPDVHTWEAGDSARGREVARELLIRAGVSVQAAVQAIQALAGGAAPNGRVMRGAMIVDARTGERLEGDPARGVRASRMDLSPGSRRKIEDALAAGGLTHPRVAEALVLSGKVLNAPGLVAELCWSDSPEYLTGYVADRQAGYQRITPLKETGDRFGGRAFFVDRATWLDKAFIEWLERRAVLFESIGTIHPPQPWSE